ncbi:hypothetical protein [uncultured Corynebacterium sp.]|uniref:hypothetical protein n=1 Tax=uncultured Corynebacterium sp. TaxID=159447 RepID=UPI002600C678|nr:hypothetical protein [uncultured Corynebacterium sp.]
MGTELEPGHAGRTLTGDEQFTDGDGNVVADVLDFWRWSSSDLMSNSLRGVLAEFLVGTALGAGTETMRAEWVAWDLETADGIKVEVKSSSYWQVWAQKAPSRITFDVAEHLAWNPLDGTFTEAPGRAADVYVFCVLGRPDDRDVNPLHLSEWQFYVASTATIDDVLGRQKSIVLGELIRRVEPLHVGFGGVRRAVESEGAKTKLRAEGLPGVEAAGDVGSTPATGIDSPDPPLR